MTAPCHVTMGAMYLGKPGAMVNLGVPQAGYQSIGSRAEAVHKLISGGTAVTRTANYKRIWLLPAAAQTEAAAQYMLAFFAGSMGLGPFVLVDPGWVNKLAPDTSSMGAVIQAITTWTPLNAGALAWDGTDVAAQPQSDIMTWTGAGNTSKIGLGSWSGSTLLPATGTAPPYVSDQGSSGSVYLRTGSSTASVSVILYGVTSTGSISVTGSTATAAISSAGWTRLTSFLASGNTTAQYEVIQILCNTNSAPVIWASAADIQYGPTNAATLGAWALGLGSPRVVFMPSTGTYPGLPAAISHFPYRDMTYTLAET